MNRREFLAALTAARSLPVIAAAANTSPGLISNPAAREGASGRILIETGCAAQSRRSPSAWGG